jgi:Rrf2 family transcriptional regulator, cysteine metabolism repressor
MRLITKETDYAIRAVLYLAAHPDGLVSSAEMATAEKIPLQFLRRILRRLIEAELVASREGAAGGVSLRPRPENIRVLDIIRVFQGEIELSECMFRRKLCANRGTCVLRKRIKAGERMLACEFAGISIADLLRDADRRGKRTVRRRAATAVKRGAR